MYKFIKQNAWAFYLGGTLGPIAHLNASTLEFYYILVPTVLLVIWSQDASNK